MKTLICAIFVSLMIAVTFSPAPVHAWANGTAPWDAPVMPGGKILKTDDTTMFIEYEMPPQAIVAWYKEALKNYKDEKWRDWAEQTYIEDQGGANWHSIGISKGGGAKTTVKITRDNMTWIMSTLLIRFAGVFLVLCILWVLLNINSAIMRKFASGAKKAA
jgi:hypothetical protein